MGDTGQPAHTASALPTCTAVMRDPITITVYRWNVLRLDGQRRPTAHHMTRADAMETDPTAPPVDGSAEFWELDPQDDSRLPVRLTTFGQAPEG